MQKRTEANRKTNIAVARIIPVLLFALMGYSSWVLTKLVCIDYLLRSDPSLGRHARVGPAVAILITYYLLLVLVVIFYGRLLDTVTRRPGYIPRGPQWYAEQAEKKRNKDRRRRSHQGRYREEKPSSSDSNELKEPLDIRYLASESLPFRVEDFWLRDVFVCNPDGRPPFCSTCYNWKPDRAHHCSELNRCLLKFDHVCPWVSGPVSATSFKFFIQFTFYAALYTLELLVVMAYYFAQRQRESNYLNAHWIVTVALGGLFFLFSGGMCMSSCQFAFINSTTIENLTRKTKVWNLAVYAPPKVLDEARAKNIPLRLISYPRPAGEQLRMLQQHVAGADGHNPTETDAEPLPAAQRMFVILETEPGANPFDIGPLSNFCDIMGETVWEWLSPIRPSPCLKPDEPRSLYKLGPVVDQLKACTGLESWSGHSSGRKHRRRRQSSLR